MDCALTRANVLTRAGAVCKLKTRGGGRGGGVKNQKHEGKGSKGACIWSLHTELAYRAWQKC